MKTDWLTQWESGRTGWHQAGGSAALRKFWPRLAAGSRVLVPLCGKSPDLLWLAHQGLHVTGVELSEIAVRAFFDETDIPFEISKCDGFKWFQARQHDITIVCADYFQFLDKPFDALYDRASLVALPPQVRAVYVQHTKSLLKPAAALLLLTLEYDQSKATGPPYSVMSDELKNYWVRIQRVGERSDSKNIPPKIRQAGISEIVEAVWLSLPFLQ